MFEPMNKELSELQQKIHRYNRVDSMLKSLREQLTAQKRKQEQLEQELLKEKLDVEKLNKMGISALFHTILGNREKQMEKERQEALAAQLKFDDNKRQIEDTQSQIKALQSEKAELRGCEGKYNELYQKKYQMLKQPGDEKAIKIIELEEKINLFNVNLREISEAITAGNRVISSLESASQSLDKAHGWGTWDMWGGGGLITDMVKHSHIDDARGFASEAQRLLNRFRTELADVKISSQITIDIDGFVKFADFFFDGLISDWVVQSRINDSRESVGRVRDNVNSVLRKLSQMQSTDKRKLESLENELSQLILNA